jgi:hypothetical protein
MTAKLWLNDGKLVLCANGKLAYQETSPCPTCAFCQSGTTPSIIVLTLAGVTDAGCGGSDCATAWNKSHTLIPLTFDPYFCQYEGDTLLRLPCSGSPSWVNVYAMLTATTFKISLGGVDDFYFQKTLVTPADCTTALLGNIPRVAGAGLPQICSCASATCTVDAVS